MRFLLKIVPLAALASMTGVGCGSSREVAEAGAAAAAAGRARWPPTAPCR